MFTRLGFPVTELERAPAAPLVIDVHIDEPEPYVGDAEHSNLIAQYAEAAWKAAKDKGLEVFNRPPDPPNLLRARSLVADNGNVRIGTQPTWFWTYLGTNAQLRRGDWLKQPDMVQAELRDHRDISASKLANCLSVNLTLLSADDPPQVLIQHRGVRTGIARVPFQCSAAGFVDREDTVWSSGEVASRAAAREAMEETSLKIPIDDIAWLAVGRDQWSGVVGMAGFAQLSAKSQDINPHTTQDDFEVDAFEWWEFTPDVVLSRWGKFGSWYALVPLGGYSILASLAYKYGEPAVEQSYKRLGIALDR